MKSNFDRRQSQLDAEEVLGALRRLPSRTPPPGLTTSLRVLASRERERAQCGGFHEVLSAWAGRTRLWVDNLMRPLAVPFAGGVLSAVALFGIWLVPTYPQQATNFSVPAALVASGGDVIVDVFLDDQGCMVSYNVVSGTGVLTDAALQYRLETMLPATDFFPKAFGKPIAGKMRLSVVPNSIIVKG